MSERALVIGGTRGTGLLIARQLLQDGSLVRAWLRHASARAKEQLGPAVEIVEGDLTRPESFRGALEQVDSIVFTAGVTGGRVGEAQVRAVTYDGIRNTLAAAQDAGFRGRFLYMSTVGVTSPSPAGTLLNLVKRNLLHWRKRAEEEIQASGLDYTVIRAGLLTNDPPGRRVIAVSQEGCPLAFSYRISRADVAEVFVQALRHPETRRTRFNVVGTSGSPREEWDLWFGALKQDA